MRQFGTVLAFEVDGGRARAADLLERLRLVRRATSLGGPETLICHPMTTTHASLTPDEQADTGVSDGLLRVSVGLEDPGDVIADVEQALR
jgi:cystathionine beta-lyase/cystathionine gamma-synthase